MNKGYILLSALICHLISCQTLSAQWTSANMIRYRDANAVYILDQETAVVVGGNEYGDSIETICRTVDRDTTWNSIMDSIRPWLSGVGFSRAGVGIAVGEGGTILRSIDAGVTWQRINLTGPAAGRNYNGVFFANTTTVYAVGGNLSNNSAQTIIKSTDAGLTWTLQMDLPGSWLHAVFFTSSNTGYAVGDNGVVLKTTNGGGGWTPLTLTGNFTTRNYNSLYFFNDNTGFIVGGYPSNDSIETILKTTDGGGTWQVTMDQLGPMFNSISFGDSTHAYVVGNSATIMFSGDGGNNWNNVNLGAVAPPDSLKLNAVFFLDSAYGLAVGQNGIILQYAGSLLTLPQVVTQPASQVTNSSAQLNGLVNANNTLTNIWFEYGTTTALGDTVLTSPATINGNSFQSFTGQAIGLLQNTVYYYAIYAGNNAGVVKGNIQQMYTADCEIPNCSFEVWDTSFLSTPTGWNILGLVSKVTSYNGSIAVQLTGDSATGNLAGAVILGNNQGNGAGFSGITGGIPFAARPDSIILHARYDIASGDNALILLLLRKNGVLFDTVILPLSGSTSGNWVTLELPITYNSSQTPDSLVIGLISTNPFSASPNPHNVLAIDDITFVGTNILLPDWNFEQWDSVTIEIPRYWSTGSAQISTVNTVQIAQSPDVESGRSALLLAGGENMEVGNITNDAYYNSPAFPVADRHNTFNGYFKYFPVGGDTLRVNLQMFSAGVSIGSMGLVIDTELSAYTALSADINYGVPSTVPDSANLQIQISNRSGSHGASRAYIDALSFDGFSVATAISASPSNSLNGISLLIYPNPANSAVTLEWEQGQKSHVEVFDLQGRPLYAIWVNSSRAEVNINELSAGVYIARVTNDAGVVNRQFEIVR